MVDLAEQCACRSRSRRFGEGVNRPRLSNREQEALLNWLRHDSKRVAAAQMYVTEHTLSTHIERIRRKYDAVGRAAPTKAAMLARALQDGLIDIDDL
ncbi:hypothetical protein A5740_03065 [Mycobacterium sp. GA-1841]|nr:hypothetical protein A5740_03065 [Mycobacterium sp. GA-1841]